MRILLLIWLPPGTILYILTVFASYSANVTDFTSLSVCAFYIPPFPSCDGCKAVNVFDGGGGQLVESMFKRSGQIKSQHKKGAIYSGLP